MNAAHHSYAIRHLTLRLDAVTGLGRPRFRIGGKTLVVEAAAREYLRGQDWWVVRGDEPASSWRYCQPTSPTPSSPRCA